MEHFSNLIQRLEFFRKNRLGFKASEGDFNVELMSCITVIDF